MIANFVCQHRDGEFSTLGRGKGLRPDGNGIIWWHIHKDLYTDDMPKHKIVLAFEKCFDAWKPHLHPIKIQSTGDVNKAQVVIRFLKNGDEELPNPFGKHTLAYAYFPHGNSMGLNADMFFNDDREWGEMHTAENYNLFKVAVHEVGHALGIYHSKVKEDIMYPQYLPNNNVNITLDTLGAVEELFGDVKLAHGGSNLQLVLKQIFPTERSLIKTNRPTLRRLCTLFGIEFARLDGKRKLARMLFAYLNQ